MTVPAFHIHLEAFTGPLQVLNDLIEEKKMDVSRVALAEVTGAYMRFLERHDVPVEDVADFLRVAAQLLFFKSCVLLPVEPEPEEDPDTLAAQLRRYQIFVEASRFIEERWNRGERLFGRPPGPVVAAVRPDIPPGVTPVLFGQTFRRLLDRLELFFSIRRGSIARLVSLEERIKALRRIMARRASFDFRDWTGFSASRREILVSFLALLELVKQRFVRAGQDAPFGSIALRRVFRVHR